MAVTALDEDVRRHGPWKNNAEMFVDVARLGYLPEPVLDVTYGIAGGFWTIYRPAQLITADLSPTSAMIVANFKHLPFADRSVPAVVYDPPYKLNGTPDPAIDTRYGVAQPTRWQDRIALILRGTTEAARVADRYLLIKVQDQVCSGKIRWQTDMVTKVADLAGFRKVDRFELHSYRKQPAGRSQEHTRSDTSQLLIFGRETRK